MSQQILIGIHSIGKKLGILSLLNSNKKVMATNFNPEHKEGKVARAMGSERKTKPFSVSLSLTLRDC